MRGKGRRRREKNYRAAHGGNHSQLPPPPDPSQVDAIPSKLRHLFDFSSSPPAPALTSTLQHNRKKRAAEKKRPSEEAEVNTAAAGGKDEDETKRNKRKRKKGQVEDLRFDTKFEEASRTRQKRRDRKKRYLEAKKKKKHKNTRTEENVDFPGQEQIKFGDVVQAPPKLINLPKAMRNVQDASKERLRLQAIEAYRKRKGWSSRPGLQLSPLDIMPSF